MFNAVFAAVLLFCATTSFAEDFETETDRASFQSEALGAESDSLFVDASSRGFTCAVKVGLSAWPTMYTTESVTGSTLEEAMQNASSRCRNYTGPYCDVGKCRAN